MRFVAFLTLAALCTSAFALKPVPRHPLLTPPTFVDRVGVGLDQGDRVIDTRDGHIQCVSEMNEGPFAGSPETAAREFLYNHKDWLGVAPSEENLKVVRTAESPMGYHVTFHRIIDNVPVYPGDVVVTLDRSNIVRFYFSSLIAVGETVPTTVGLSADRALEIAYGHLKPEAFADLGPETDLVVWAGDNRDFATCWRVRQFVQRPRGDWEVLVDAVTGEIRRVADRLRYLDGTGGVFRPDPLSTARVNYGATGYTDGSDASTTQLQAQIMIDTLRDITLTGSTYSLMGPCVQIRDWDPPTVVPATATHPDSFRFTRQAQGFEDVNVYFHISTAQRWIQELGFDNIQNLAMWIDPHGVNGEDNAYYMPGSNRIAYGEGGVDDAEDADVVWHEYGHAIQEGTVPGWGGSEEGAMGEGFGDYWAASWSRVHSDWHHTWVYNWDGHNTFWSGRVLNINRHYPEGMVDQVHEDGQIWSRPCYETMQDIGRPAMDQLVLQHHFLLGTSATFPTAGRALLTSDATLNGGANQWAIYTRFSDRGILSAPPPFALTYPQGGELLPLDSTATVTWGTGALPDSVRIQLSRSGNAGPWETVIAATPNVGHASFTVTGPASQTCRVRISTIGANARSDSSDQNFVIDNAGTVFAESFETGATDWTHTTPGTPWIDQWHLSVEQAQSGTHAYKCGDTGAGNYSARCDARLTSPWIDELPEHAMLDYAFRLNAELLTTAGVDSAIDGAILELFTDGVTFTQVSPQVNGYTHQIRRATTSTGPFVRGTNVWSGDINEWTRVTMNPTPWAGDSIQLRFRFGSSSNTNREGWYIDDVKIYAPAYLPPVEDVTCRRVNDTIVLRWRAGNAPYYRVYSSTTMDGPFNTLEGTTNQTVFTVPGAMSDVPKYFHVVQWDGN